MDNKTIGIKNFFLLYYDKEFLLKIKNDVSCLYKFMEFNKLNYMRVKKEFEFSIVLGRKVNIFVVCLYRPSGTNVNLFILKQEKMLSEMPLHSRVILAGDFNINWADKLHGHFHLIDNLLKSFNLNTNVNDFTRVSSISSSIIDYICTIFYKNAVR